jgi:prevent-host-death family protein
MTQYSTSDLSRKSGDIIAEALRRPVTITQRNKPRLVLLNIEDYRRLAATAGTRRTGRPMSRREVDDLVLGTTNAPYRRSITAAALAKCLASGKSEPWTVHVATFFTDVKPELVFEFAEMHGISRRVLASSYRALKTATGERNPALEALLDQLAPAP